MSTASQNSVCSIRLVIVASPHKFVHCNELNQIKANRTYFMRHWHLAHGARSVSLCGAVNIELVRVSIWVRRCCHIENSDSIYFYLFSMYGPPRTPPPIYYHFPPQLSVLLAWIINVDYQIVFLVIHFPFQLFWLQILIKVSGFAMQYRFVRVFWRQPPGLMSMPINFIASRHSFLN